jgi:hypothetical protein
MVGRETALLSGRRHRNTPARRTEGGFDCSKIPAIRATPVAESRTGTDFSSTILCTSRRAQDARLRIGQPAPVPLAVSDYAGTPRSEPSRLPSARRCKCATPCATRAVICVGSPSRAGAGRRASPVGLRGRSVTGRSADTVVSRGSARLASPLAVHRSSGGFQACWLDGSRVRCVRPASSPPAGSRYCAAVNASCGSRTVAMSFRVAAGLMS